MGRKNRTSNRESRKKSRRVDNEPLLQAVKQERSRKYVEAAKRELKPLTHNQAKYDKAIFGGKITFGIGPAGTGKTWWAAMRAAEELKAGRIEKIVVTRPAVEAGENLGFMPGEMDEKYEPYFRPVKDALEESFGTGHLEYLLKNGTIEARPLAFLRGATIKNAWLIADEMQNATRTQMKMLLTRIGENSKFVVNGDPTQCDLPAHTNSGLIDAIKRLKGVGGVMTVRFTEDDVVRSGIAQQIVKAYSNNRASEELDDYIDADEDENTEGLRKVLRVDDK